MLPVLPHPADGRGLFISADGIDGSGKSAALAVLVRRLGEVTPTSNIVVTREPGGTPLAERIRELILNLPMDALTEALLVFAARRDHVRYVIEPALARGQIVVCDRFTDASFAYQGGGAGFDKARLSTLESWVHGSLQPDLTLWFDVDPEIAAQRRASARAPDRFESNEIDYFTRVRDAYAERMQAAPERFVRIDASPSPEVVWTQVEAAVTSLIKQRRDASAESASLDREKSCLSVF